MSVPSSGCSAVNAGEEARFHWKQCGGKQRAVRSGRDTGLPWPVPSRWKWDRRDGASTTSVSSEARPLPERCAGGELLFPYLCHHSKDVTRGLDNSNLHREPVRWKSGKLDSHGAALIQNPGSVWHERPLTSGVPQSSVLKEREHPLSLHPLQVGP